MRGARTWSVVLALALVVGIGGPACKKKGPQPGEGEAGAGLVKVTATAKGAVRALSIDPSLFVPDEREVVEDLIVAAVQDAQARAQAAAQAELAKVTGGLELPPGLKLPF